MLSSFSSKSKLATTTFSLLSATPIYHHTKHIQQQQQFSSSAAANEPERKQETIGLEPPRFRPMKKPIIKGRTMKDKKTQTLADTVENPFKGKGLPFGRRIIFEAPSEEDLARGKNWSGFIDRFSQYQDFDLIEKGWPDEDLYRFPKFKRPFDDITSKPDPIFHYYIENMAIHIDMMRYIPHLKPLVPELRRDFKNITKPVRDITKEVFLDKKNPLNKNKTTIGNPDKFNEQGLVKKDIYENETSTEKESRTRKEELMEEINTITLRTHIDDCVEKKDFVRLIFVDAMGTKYFIYGMIGETLLQACRRYLIPIDGYCNSYDRGHVRVYGDGAFCHTCQVDISPKYFHLIPPYDYQEKRAFHRFRSITPTSRLGCCIWIRPEFDGMVINIPVSLVMPYGRTED